MPRSRLLSPRKGIVSSPIGSNRILLNMELKCRSQKVQFGRHTPILGISRGSVSSCQGSASRSAASEHAGRARKAAKDVALAGFDAQRTLTFPAVGRRHKHAIHKICAVEFEDLSFAAPNKSGFGM